MSTPDNTTEFLAAMDAARIDTFPSIKERLARIMYLDMSKTLDMEPRDWATFVHGEGDVYRNAVDAIFTELQPMARDLRHVYDAALCCLPAGCEIDDEVIAWEAMIQHIKDGGS